MKENTIYQEWESKLNPRGTTLEHGMEIFSNICEDRINQLRAEIKEASEMFKEKVKGER